MCIYIYTPVYIQVKSHDIILYNPIKSEQNPCWIPFILHRKKKTSIGITFFSPRKTRLVYHGGFTMMHGGIKNGITMGICQQYDTVIGSENRGLPPMIVMWKSGKWWFSHGFSAFHALSMGRSFLIRNILHRVSHKYHHKSMVGRSEISVEYTMWFKVLDPQILIFLACKNLFRSWSFFV